VVSPALLWAGLSTVDRPVAVARAAPADPGPRPLAVYRVCQAAFFTRSGFGSLTTICYTTWGGLWRRNRRLAHSAPTDETARRTRRIRRRATCRCAACPGHHLGCSVFVKRAGDRYTKAREAACGRDGELMRMGIPRLLLAALLAGDLAGEPRLPQSALWCRFRSPRRRCRRAEIWPRTHLHSWH
jgi:hypothetical protein